MNDEMKHPLFDQVRQRQDTALDQGSELRARNAAAAWNARRGKPGRRGLRLTLGLGLAGAAALVVAIAVRPAPIQYRVETARMQFSDGSTVALAAGATARVAETGARHVRLSVTVGQARVHVIPGQGVRWRVDAGPFSVHVKGTIFDVAWQPEKKTFQLAVIEGRVEVDGPTSGPSGETKRRSVGQGEVLEVDLRPLRPVTEPLPEPPVPVTAPPASHRSRGSVASAVPSAPRAPVVPGDSRDICGAKDARALLALADAARASGEPAHAAQAYECVRTRAPGTDDAALAAYMLGRLASETAADPARAARWFKRYLDERPRGELAEPSLGRLMEAQASLADVEATRRTARTYLERHPRGIHADLARRILGP
jgi:hypothetical protein